MIYRKWAALLSLCTNKFCVVINKQQGWEVRTRRLYYVGNVHEKELSCGPYVLAAL